MTQPHSNARRPRGVRLREISDGVTAAVPLTVVLLPDSSYNPVHRPTVQILIRDNLQGNAVLLPVTFHGLGLKGKQQVDGFPTIEGESCAHVGTAPLHHLQ